MKRLNELKNKYFNLPIKKKIQLTISVALTAALMISLPVLAWFANSKKMSSMIRVNAPTVLTIGAGADDASDMIDLADINVEEKVGITRVTEGDYVFAVKGKYLSAYDLQIARTTNIPFQYKVYRVSNVVKTDDGNDDNENADLLHGLGTSDADLATSLANGEYNGNHYIVAEYTSSEGTKYYYPYLNGTVIDGEYLNPKDKSDPIAVGGLTKIGDGEENINNDETFHKRNYTITENTTYDNVNEYAEPLYWQATNTAVNYKIDNGDFVDYYVLKIIWTENFSNNKETDMIYITARHGNQF